MDLDRRYKFLRFLIWIWTGDPNFQILDLESGSAIQIFEKYQEILRLSKNEQINNKKTTRLNLKLTWS